MLHFTTLHILASTPLLLNTAVGYMYQYLSSLSSNRSLWNSFLANILAISLHSRHVLVLLELNHEARSCIKIYPFCGHITHSHKSVFHSHNNRRHCRVWRKQNVKYQAKLIQTTVKLPVSVQILGATNNRGRSLQRNVNGNMDSAKYHSDIIHDNELTCEFVVFLQKGYIFMHDLAPCHNF